MRFPQPEVPTLAELQSTVEFLRTRELVTAEQAYQLRVALPQQREQSAYTLKHLGAHLGIGVVFAFDVVPLPLGTIARVGWVVFARVREEVRRRRDLARVHSLGVLLIAAIPWFGYAAYLLPLRRDAGELSFVLANHMWIARKEVTYEEAIDGRSAPFRRFARWLVPLPWGERVNNST